ESPLQKLKCEMIYGNRTLIAEQMELEIFEYIEIWYNKKRYHSALDSLTIDEFWIIYKNSA
ncbi:MAG: IS3 family transposase, partial [Prevotellaceae bacterium]|nr:IS3 family transposase [Prevotellaceae bacterium]